MKHEIVLESLGEGITEAYVSAWLKQVGDPISVGEGLVEMMTDKVNVVIESEVDGTVAEIRFPVEARVAIGSVLAVIDG
ncbi:MAG TPA: biotin/lipoyl-containing protein [Allosphingosinicella sp.]|nr:biotin/lipoyl-containing protein [Allosphingosinicella sp.]